MGHSRPDDAVFYAFCRHQENYEELIGHLQNELSRSGSIRLRAGVYKNVDLKAPVNSWFTAAKSALASSEAAVAYVG